MRSTERAGRWTLGVLVWAAAACSSGTPEKPLPPGVAEVHAPEPLEISGVASLREGYAVVGDSHPGEGRIWPGGARFDIDPRATDLEALDVVIDDAGRELWLFGGEDAGVVFDGDGGWVVLPESFAETCERGLEGLAVRRVPAAPQEGGALGAVASEVQTVEETSVETMEKTASGETGIEATVEATVEETVEETVWEVAAVWEGGVYHRPCLGRSEATARPRVVIFRWRRGQTELGPHRVFELAVPSPGPREVFRAPELVWLEDELLALLASQAVDRTAYEHTWLQRFDLTGQPVGEPVRLEERWGDYRAGRNWEAMDWTHDGRALVLGWDALTGHRALVIVPFPLSESSGVASADVAED